MGGIKSGMMACKHHETSKNPKLISIKDTFNSSEVKGYNVKSKSRITVTDQKLLLHSNSARGSKQYPLLSWYTQSWKNNAKIYYEVSLRTL